MPRAAVRAAVAGGLQPLPRLWQELWIILVALPPYGLGKDLGSKTSMNLRPSMFQLQKTYRQL